LIRGGALPNTVYYPSENIFEIESDPNLSLSTSAFILERFALYLEEAVNYEIRKDPGGVEGNYSWRKEGGGGFSNIPDSLSTFCGDPPVYSLLLTTAFTGGDTELDLEFDITDEDEAKLDCCLVGSWEETSDKIRANMVTIMGDTRVEIVSLSGRLVLSLGEDHISIFYPDGYVTVFEAPDLPLMTVSMEGMNSSKYFTPEEGIIRTVDEDLGLVAHLTSVGINENLVLGEMPMLSGPFVSRDTAYTCTETTLTLETGGFAPFSSTTYQRISDEPMTPEPVEDLPPPPDVGEGAPSDVGLPGGICMAASLTDFATSGNTAVWTLTNISAEALEISAISLDKPEGNGALTGVSLGGEAIWAGSEGSSYFRIYRNWLGTPALLTLDPGEEASLLFTFAGETAAGIDYIVIVEFTNGCLTSDMR
jgi:hypothetical protein